MASVREVKACLSALIREAALGTEVVVTDRGRPVARLLAVTAEPPDALAVKLEERGIIGPAVPVPATVVPVGTVPSGLALRYLDEDRPGG